MHRALIDPTNLIWKPHGAVIGTYKALLDDHCSGLNAFMSQRDNPEVNG